MLGSGMLLVGVPMAIGSCLRANREGADRGFALAAIVVCAVAILLTIAELFVPGGVIRPFLP